MQPDPNSPLASLSVERAYSFTRHELEKTDGLAPAVLRVLPSQSRRRRRALAAAPRPWRTASTSVDLGPHGIPPSSVVSRVNVEHRERDPHAQARSDDDA